MNTPMAVASALLQARAQEKNEAWKAKQQTAAATKRGDGSKAAKARERQQQLEDEALAHAEEAADAALFGEDEESDGEYDAAAAAADAAEAECALMIIPSYVHVIIPVSICLGRRGERRGIRRGGGGGGGRCGSGVRPLFHSFLAHESGCQTYLRIGVTDEGSDRECDAAAAAADAAEAECAPLPASSPAQVSGCRTYFCIAFKGAGCRVQ